MNGPVFVAMVNPKSGGNVGTQLLNRFKEILDEDRIFSLTDGGPEKGLTKFQNAANLRVIACGGDGTVGWILSAMDNMTFPHGRPAIGIIPLGTGNDLSRTLHWGGRYRDKPLKKILIDIGKADVVNMDRWLLSVTLDENVLLTETDLKAEERLPLNVMNNYFSLGIDAHIALNFHKARNNNPEQFTSRTRNLLFYGLEGGKDLFKHQWRNLVDFITLECDGKDMTHKLKGFHSVIFLNISSYAGGTRPWGVRHGEQSIDDGKIEVVAVDNLDLAILHAGGTGTSITQCFNAVIHTKKSIPVQVDGEPCLMRPCKIEINLDKRNQQPAKMLMKNKHGYCAIKDEEIENWAALKIQNSFKEYKSQKSTKSLESKPSCE